MWLACGSDGDDLGVENTCEHGDHPAPANKRFCSDACAACELAEHPGGKAECAGLCDKTRAQKASANFGRPTKCGSAGCNECYGSSSRECATLHRRYGTNG